MGLVSLVKTLVDNSHKKPKYLKEEVFDDDEIFKIVIEKTEDKTVKNLKKDYPDKFEKLEEALFNYIGKNDLKILETEFPDSKWKYLTKKIKLSSWIFW